MINRSEASISTMQMHYFIEVAECCNFSRAAQQLYTTQSALSKSIASIEKSLDIQLFIRNRKRLSLTEAGWHCYKAWKALLSRFEDSVDECRMLQGGRRGSLNLGVLDSHQPNDVVFPVIRSFTALYPEIRIQVEAFPAQEVRKHLINGTVDLVFTVLYDIEQLGAEEFDYKMLRRCPHSVGMLPSNPLAAREILLVEELRGLDFVSISPLSTPSYNGMLNDLCMEHGFCPNISRYTGCANALSYNLTKDNEIFLCDQFFRDYNNNALCFRPLLGTSSGVVAAWRRSSDKKALEIFRKLL